MTQKQTPNNQPQTSIEIVIQKIKDNRIKQNITQQQLSEKSGVPTVMISLIEDGDVIPKIGVLYKLTLALVRLEGHPIGDLPWLSDNNNNAEKDDRP